MYIYIYSGVHLIIYYSGAKASERSVVGDAVEDFGPKMTSSEKQTLWALCRTKHDVRTCLTTLLKQKY